jgi:hypothetical protein
MDSKKRVAGRILETLPFVFLTILCVWIVFSPAKGFGPFFVVVVGLILLWVIGFGISFLNDG